MDAKDVDGSRRPCTDSDGKRARVTDDPMSDYTVGKLIGEGNFAVVRHAVERASGIGRALKLIRRSTTSASDFEREQAILKAAGSHPHIAALVNSFETTDAWVMVLELCHAEVFERLQQGPYSETTAASVIRQCADALTHLHQRHIVRQHDSNPHTQFRRRSEPSLIGAPCGWV